jgi:hypothetical protein
MVPLAGGWPRQRDGEWLFRRISYLAVPPTTAATQDILGIFRILVAFDVFEQDVKAAGLHCGYNLQFDVYLQEEEVSG